MIDPTPILSRDYSRLIEAPGVTQDEIDYKAAEILRGLSALDLSDAIYEQAEAIRAAVIDGRVDDLALIVHGAINDYCQRVALRILEEK